MAKNKTSKPREKLKPIKNRATKVSIDVALLEYVRCGDSAWRASKIAGVSHTTIQRAWDKMSEEERAVYRERAAVITETVEDRIIAQEVKVVTEVTEKLQEVGNLALDELRSRLNDDLRRMEMKDADLINIATKCLGLAEDNLKTKEEQKNNVTMNVAQMFNILDNSIQEHLQKSSMIYEE